MIRRGDVSVSLLDLEARSRRAREWQRVPRRRLPWRRRRQRL